MPTQAPHTNLPLIMAYINCDSEVSGTQDSSISSRGNTLSAETPSPQQSEVSDYKEPGAGAGVVSDHKELHPGVSGPVTGPAAAASLRVGSERDSGCLSHCPRLSDSPGETTLRIEATLGLVEPLRLVLASCRDRDSWPASLALANGASRPGAFGAAQGADTELSLRPWWDGERRIGQPVLLGFQSGERRGGQGSGFQSGERRGGQGSGFQSGERRGGHAHGFPLAEGPTGQHGHGHGPNGVVAALMDEALGEVSGLLAFWGQAPDALAVWVAGLLEEKLYSTVYGTVRYSTSGQDRREYYLASLAEVRRLCLVPTSGEGGLLPLTSSLTSPVSPALGPGAQWPHHEPEGNKKSSGAQGGQEVQSRGATWARRIFPARRFPGSWQVPASAQAGTSPASLGALQSNGGGGCQAVWADGLAGSQAGTSLPSLAGLQSNGGGQALQGSPKAEPRDCIGESPTPGGDCIGDAAWERHQQMKGQHLLQLQLCFLALTSRLQENELCLAAPGGSARASKRLSPSELATVTDFRRLVLGLVLFLSAERGRVPGRFGVEKLGRLEREVGQILGIMGQKAEGGGLDMPLIARRMLPEASSASAKEGPTSGVAAASAEESTTSGMAPARGPGAAGPVCDGATPTPDFRGMRIKSEPGVAFGSAGMSINTKPAGGMKRTLSCSSVAGPLWHNKRACAHKAA